MRRAVLAASVWLAAASLALGDQVPGLALPIDLLATTLDERDLLGVPPGPAFPAAPDARDAERAFGMFQRGDWMAAADLARPLAEAGDGAMAGLLARIHGEGLGVVADADEGFRWLERAAEAGDPTARHDLAVALLTGSGVSRDDARALDLLRDLAGEGRAAATYDLAQALLAPGRTASQRTEGERALVEAADAGLPQAAYAYARFIDETAEREDLEARGRALNRLATAARAGLVEAQLELGIWLTTGRAGQRDVRMARAWLERAASAGLELAAERLRRLDAASMDMDRSLPGVDWTRRSTGMDPANDRVAASAVPTVRDAAERTTPR